MKRNSYIVSVVILIYFNCTAQSISTIPSLKKPTIFQQRINLLDSIYRFQNCFDNSNITSESIQYMERVTHIKAHGEGTWAGLLIAFTPSDLALWKNWYKNIGSKRIGIIL